MKRVIILILALMPLIVFSQECDCTSKFKWAKKIFEENDAGFVHTLEKKTDLAYQIHNQKFEEKVSEIKDPIVCLQALYQWLRFFRLGHIGIRLTEQAKKTEVKIDSDKIRAQYKDWEKLEVDIDDFTTYLKSKKSCDFEGIWLSEPYEIGVKKIGEEYVGFIIEADGSYWTEGQVKFKIHADKTGTYYMRDHSPRNFDAAKLLGKNYLEMGSNSLKRTLPELVDDAPDTKRYFNIMEARKPFFEAIDDNTVMLRIPSFRIKQKKYIDSLIVKHKAQILSTPNLIIDLRNNGGGSGQSYSELLPLIYTDTIRGLGVEFLSTPLSNEKLLRLAEDTENDFSDSDREMFKREYEKLSKHIGEFVNLDSVIVDKTYYDTIHPYPQKVAIIINGDCASATEQFLLAAKQSKKVKLFGTKTFGALDVSNMNFAPSPCGDFELGYCTSKSYRIPDMAIDDVGIQPDYYLDQEIPKYEWIKHVTKILNH